MLLLCPAFIGSCIGSTGGGLKVVHILLLFKQGNHESKRLAHPNTVYSIKLDNHALSEQILKVIWGSSPAYVLVFTTNTLVVATTGVDNFSTFASVVATLSNLGPGLGVVVDNLTGTSLVVK